MRRNPFDNSKRQRDYNSFTNVILRFMGMGGSDGLLAVFAWLLSILLQILSVGAKILTRKYLGIRVAGRLRFVIHILIIIYLALAPLEYNFVQLAENETNNLLGYVVLIFILWLRNYIDFPKRIGVEANSYFRGYGMFMSVKKFNEKRSKWYRLLDPILLIILTRAVHLFLGDEVALLAYILYASTFVLLIEEFLHIYDDINTNLDLTDAQSYAQHKIVGGQDKLSDLGY